VQTLREAKSVAESREQEEEEFVELRKSNFGAQFDDFQGTRCARKKFMKNSDKHFV